MGHAAGIKITAHAHGAQSIKDAIDAGVDSVEHASLADDEAIALALKNQVALSMDVYNGTYIAEVGPEQGYPEEFIRKNNETPCVLAPDRAIRPRRACRPGPAAPP